MTPDPVRDGMNWYQYYLSDPVNFWDPLGLWIDESEIDVKLSNKLYGTAGAMAVTGLVATQVDSPVPGPGDIAGAIIEVGAGAVVVGAMAVDAYDKVISWYDNRPNG